jgi:acetamidase/formamidase
VTLHELPLEGRTLHGHFSCGLEPVLEVDSGDSVSISTPNAGWHLADGSLFEPRHEELDGGHALAGPILVRGARGGGTLAVRVDEVVPASWGVTLTTYPHLVAGTTLYLPIPVDGAFFSAGDGHARQGDGEASGTAIECPAEATLTLSLEDVRLEWPVARTAGAWLAFGFDEDLDEAARIATAGIVRLISREHGVGEDDALALASVVADLRVTQVVNGVKGVHAVLADGAIR